MTSPIVICGQDPSFQFFFSFCFSLFSRSEFYMPSVHESSPSALALVSTFTVKSCGIMACQRIGREEVNSWRIAGRIHQVEWCRLTVCRYLLSISPYVPKLPIKAIIRLCLGPLGSRSPVVSWRFLLRSSAPCFADCKEQTGVGGFLTSEEVEGRGVIG